MKRYRDRWRLAAGAACVLAMLALAAGCGEEKPPVNPPAKPDAGNMKSMGAENGTPAAAAGVKVFTCGMDNYFQATPGECPKCKMKLAETPVVNPDPTVCAVTGEKIKKPVYVMANGKAFALCCSDCEADVKKDPDGVMKKAMERAGKTQ